MANYSKTTNFTAKDNLPSGNAAKKILGSLFDTEYDNISTAIATKANLADPTFTGTVSLAALTTSGVVTVGSNIVSDTDSTDSLGSTSVRWAKVWTDELTSGTLTVTSGSITDSSGAISFGNENLTTTGNVSVANATASGLITGGSFVLASGATVTAVLDEDAMGSNSATVLATQQSIKAYVDATVVDIGALTISGTPVTNDFARFTDGNTLEGRSYAEARADLSLEIGSDVQAYDADTAKLDVAQTFTKTQTWTKGSDISSATELPLTSTGNYFDVTGTTTATSFANLAVGTVVKLHFDAALILTNNTDIVCLSGANVTTAAGDEAEFVYFDIGKVRMTSYARADGTSLVAPSGLSLGTPVESTSGTAINFTGLPSGTKQIIVTFKNVSTNGTSAITVRIGDSGGIETGGYNCTSANQINTAVATEGVTSGFQLKTANASYKLSGSIIMTLENSTTNSWSAQGAWSDISVSNNLFSTAGGKSLSAELTQVSVTTAGGSDAFDFGEINIAYQ